MHIENSNLNLDDIARFLIRLSDETLKYFSLYPKVRTKKRALQLASRELKKKNQRIFVAKVEDKIVAFGILKFFSKTSKKYICELGIVVADDSRGKGYGEKLCKKMLEWARQNRYKKIWLTVYTDNTKAIHLYKKLGFEIEGLFMNTEYEKENPRHSLGMGYFFTDDVSLKRKKIWENLFKMLAQR